MKHGVFKEIREPGTYWDNRKPKGVWCVYFNGQWRGTYPQKRIAAGHFRLLEERYNCLGADPSQPPAVGGK